MDTLPDWPRTPPVCSRCGKSLDYLVEKDVGSFVCVKGTHICDACLTPEERAQYLTRETPKIGTG